MMVKVIIGSQKNDPSCHDGIAPQTDDGRANVASSLIPTQITGPPRTSLKAPHGVMPTPDPTHQQTNLPNLYHLGMRCISSEISAFVMT